MLNFGSAVAALIAIANPIGAAPVFIELTAGESRTDHRRAAERASAAVLVILVAAAVGGRWLLQLLGISTDAFRAAGGLIILLMGLEMLGGHTTRLQRHDGDQAQASPDDSIFVPFAMPLVAGPGAITTVITLTARNPDLAGLVEVIAAIGVTSILLLVVLYGATLIGNRFTPRAHAILLRFLGLVLAAIGVQLILDGVKAFLAA